MIGSLKSVGLPDSAYHTSMGAMVTSDKILRDLKSNVSLSSAAHEQVHSVYGGDPRGTGKAEGRTEIAEDIHIPGDLDGYYDFYSTQGPLHGHQSVLPPPYYSRYGYSGMI